MRIITSIVTVLGLIAGLIVFVTSKRAEAAVIYEPPLAAGADPFTSAVDVAAASVGAVIPTPSPTDGTPSPGATGSPTGTPGGTGTSSPGATPVPGSTAGGGFGGSGYTTVCDRELLIRSLQARPAALAEWARIRGIAPAALPEYIRGLKPVTLNEDMRVTNYSFKGGKAVPFQSIQPAGTAVLVDGAGNVVTRCRCGNPLTEPKAVKKGTCQGCPKGYKAPLPLAAGQVPKVLQVINPPPVVSATPTASPTPTPTATPPPPSTNISIGASASASKTFSAQYPVRYGIDNSRATSWFSKGPEPENGNTSTYTITLKRPSTVTRIEFVDNSGNSDRSVRSGFGFGKWRIELLPATGQTPLATIRPTRDPTRSQTIAVPSVKGVVRVRFIGEQHQDKTCGGFAALWTFGYATA